MDHLPRGVKPGVIVRVRHKVGRKLKSHQGVLKRIEGGAHIPGFHRLTVIDDDGRNYQIDLKDAVWIRRPREANAIRQRVHGKGAVRGS